jgi:hypothetical protein
MTPAFRVKFGLLAILAAFLGIFAWSAAQGQFRPPRSPMNPNPGSQPGNRPPGGMGMGGMNPPGGMGMNGMNPPGGMGGIGWTCPKCGRTGQGAIPPGTCPGCGVKFINGAGNGSAGGVFGNPGGAPGMNPPGMNPPGMNPPGMNPPGMNPGGLPNNGPVFENVWTCGKCGKELGRGLSAPPDRCPHCGARIINGVGNGVSQPGMQGTVPTGDSSADSSSGGMKSSKKLLIGAAIGVGILVVLGVLLGGAWLVVQIVRSSDPASRPRRRRRRRDDYDD